MALKKEGSRNIRLGIFVLAGTVFLIVALYMIGNKRNLFSNTFLLRADFKTVNGLMVGHNVRYAGIDVGTVKTISFINDSAVSVIMMIEEKYQPNIRKNAIAAIGTDGLMGNKLVNISPGNGSAETVEDGDVLASLQPLETDEMIRTLSRTNENMRIITEDLKRITEKINNSNSLWSLLSDTIVADNIRQAIVNIQVTGQNSAVVTGDLTRITKDIRSGKGSVGALITDTAMYGQLRQSIVNIQLVSDRVAVLSGDMSMLSNQVKSGQGTVGMLMMDTSFVSNLNASVVNLKEGTAGFNDNMEALKHSFLLKRYFRKQEKTKVPAN